MERIQIGTEGKIGLVNITQRVEEYAGRKKDGICFVFVPHATAALMMQEDETGLKKDIIGKIREIFYNGDYEHDRIDNNAAAHLGSGFLKQFVLLPVQDGKLVRGTWQEIFLVELDGPRNRDVILV